MKKHSGKKNICLALILTGICLSMLAVSVYDDKVYVYLFFQKLQELLEKEEASAKVQAVAIVNFTGAELLEEPDLIVFYDSEGSVLECAFSEDGNQNLTITAEDLSDVRMSFNVLDAVIMLPGITGKQVWNINFDYSEKSYDIEVIGKDELQTGLLKTGVLHSKRYKKPDRTL